MIVDHQAHWIPRSSLERITGRAGHPRAERVDGRYVLERFPGERRLLRDELFDLDAQLASMDEHGIDAMVSSPTAMAGVDELDVREAVEAVEELNQSNAAAQRAHPGRFVGLAALPMGHPEAALDVLDRAIERHHLRGVGMLSNIGGRSIVSERTMPVFERIAHHGVPLFLHPAHRSMAYSRDTEHAIESGVNWMCDTTAAALALILGGVLDRCPGLTVVHPHLGGALPYLRGRIAGIARRAGRDLDLDGQLRTRFYVDSVGETPEALPLAVGVYGPDRVLFGTDHPWLEHGPRLAYVRESLPGELAGRVLERNAIPGLVPLSAGV